jgi:anti-sigma regulatory factor (Ser/Thr protein kinase)
MSGGTGAVSAGRGATPPAGAKEHGSSAGTAIPGPLFESSLTLAALITAPACARGHVRAVALEWHLAAVVDTAALLVSELVTNAVRASDRLQTAGPPVIRLRVSCDGTALVIHVWDACDDMPVRQDAGPDAVGGRGLLLVETLGKDWGAYRQADGKVVWVLITPGGP